MENITNKHIYDALIEMRDGNEKRIAAIESIMYDNPDTNTKGLVHQVSVHKDEITELKAVKRVVVAKAGMLGFFSGIVAWCIDHFIKK